MADGPPKDPCMGAAGSPISGGANMAGWCMAELGGGLRWWGCREGIPLPGNVELLGVECSG